MISKRDWTSREEGCGGREAKCFHVPKFNLADLEKQAFKKLKQIIEFNKHFEGIFEFVYPFSIVFKNRQKNSQDHVLDFNRSEQNLILIEFLFFNFHLAKLHMLPKI